MPDLTATRPATGAPIDTPWGQQVHDAVEGIQAGTANLVYSTSSSASLAITFPRAYTVAPIVLATQAGGSTVHCSAVGSVTTTGFTLFGFHRDGSNVTGTVVFVWAAIGNPA